MTRATPYVLAFPFTGRWIVQNSPADRIPSHGTDLFGSSHAIDFVPVDGEGRSTRRRFVGLVGTEPPEDFVGFGREILAPIDGEVVRVHDGEPDHRARRAPLALLAYALTQASRIRGGAPAIAGNHVVLRIDGDALVLLAHLRRGSVRVGRGDVLRTGDVVGECGNSGNSTEPHVHVQVSTSLDRDGRGLPLAFVRADGEIGMPVSGEIVDV
ncbi:peptidoglycan DD-metalloendopeptidase family protein [Microbacterium sp. NPDC089696]|uniref:peptidoglycan DD-metalloendopeptidase family protein n=1 Tax=Microbacterium sp. NPDC089696 TaxID=3364199 RepID=UPI0038089FE9